MSDDDGLILLRRVENYAGISGCRLFAFFLIASYITANYGANALAIRFLLATSRITNIEKDSLEVAPSTLDIFSSLIGSRHAGRFHVAVCVITVRCLSVCLSLPYFLPSVNVVMVRGRLDILVAKASDW